MRDAPTTQAEQEDAVREAWAYLTPHPYSDGPIILDPSKMRKAIATLRTERDAAVTRAAEEEVGAAMDRAFREIADLRVAKVEAQRDQLAADLRKAREALRGFGDEAARYDCPRSGSPGLPDSSEIRFPIGAFRAADKLVRALTPDPKDAGGTAKGEDHGR